MGDVAVTVDRMVQDEMCADRGGAVCRCFPTKAIKMWLEMNDRQVAGRAQEGGRGRKGRVREGEGVESYFRTRAALVFQDKGV